MSNIRRMLNPPSLHPNAENLKVQKFPTCTGCFNNGQFEVSNNEDTWVPCSCLCGDCVNQNHHSLYYPD
jgi:hypothetical protein